MADLSGVLRKTIDGLPRATPQLRAKVYEKARAAIQRQVQAANPPLAEEVVAARLAALEDAIDRTEAHYVGRDASDGDAAPADAGAPAPASAAPPPSPPVQAKPAVPPAAEPRPAFMPRAEAAPAVSAAGPSNGKTASGSDDRGAASAFPGFRKASEPARREPPPFFPISAEEPADSTRPASVGAPFIVSPGNGTSRRPDEDDDDDVIPADIRRDDTDIPEADVSAPRYGARQRQRGSRSKGPLAAAAVVLLLAGAGAAGWIYRDDLEALLIDTTPGIETIATGNEGEAPTAGEATTGTPDAPAAAEGEAAPEGETDVAAVTPPAAATANGQSNRQFTQRLLPDGSEVDEGPAPGAANAFDEGTDISPASPVAEAGEVPSATPTVSSDIGEAPATVGDEPAAAADASPPPATGEAEVAAVAPAENGVPVAQKAVFYQERTETTPGTQESGNVVWSVVNEPPSEGQPAEPAIRAVADVPDENLKLTMTIRRNADPTLPASHVVELMFDTPENFAGGGVANVQRLALKATEEARGEPLIGVAGKISDGFFIIALNNLDQAVQNNLSLLESQQWIDIPLAYATGRRALMSIEKGVPGDRVFKEAMDAWAAKT
ncbi:hypothetical protein [Aurantimonas sp. HBX-1]|uniref:hypothetical protein n=1 Tax=Aurantimonas sp. HBX-1 TaxID=2906072 RepID=UPI001F37CF6D|nr:hypothetical protein [Aurantimonas sp. HBX-1]UIJ70809.1 hypothetical protein LXB15_13810 [Aurantimonas sp. HBX-1]